MGCGFVFSGVGRLLCFEDAVRGRHRQQRVCWLKKAREEAEDREDGRRGGGRMEVINMPLGCLKDGSSACVIHRGK